MDKKYNHNDPKDKLNKNDTQDKLESMREIVMDHDKCKEIAQKLCAYISQK